MIDYQQVFHSGVLVPDLGAAMSDLGTSLGVEWAATREVEQSVWSPEAGCATVPLRFTYSVHGPQHIELVEGPTGTVWAAGETPGVHHVGVWVDDVEKETRSLLGAGWHMIAAHHPPEDGFGVFSYVAPPSGLIVELVASVIRPQFEAWWSAGAAVGRPAAGRHHSSA